MNKKYVIIGVFIISAILVVANYQSIFKAVVPPMPEIVSSSADGSSSSLFDYSMKVKGTLTNKGGDGYVVVEAIAYQGSNSWKKTKQMYLNSYQTENFELVFDEVKFLDSNPEYNVKTYALGGIAE